jgi:pilus assembly protein CpaB
VRNAITAGQPITQGALVKPGDRGFLAAALGPGMRAVTVPVSAQTGVAGFVFPGDRIDLVLTQTVTGGGDGPPLKVSETIMRNMRVLATDQRTDNTVDDKGKSVVRTFSNVTLEATPKIAEQIAVAQTLGSISLSLRSIADNNSELEQAIASGDVKVPEGTDPKAEKAMLAQIASQPATGNTTFATGADVSRFQRRTVPGKTAEAAPAPGASQGAPGGYPGATSGPVVHVARGNTVIDVSVGGKK